MKKSSILIAILLIITTAFSQDIEFERPNYKKIEKEIKKEESKFYYEDLFDRFVKGDKTFNLEEKRHLYYGFSYQDKYSSYGSSDYTDSLMVYFEKDTLTETDYNSIIKFSSFILDTNPFDLRALNYLAYSYYSIGNKELEHKYGYKISPLQSKGKSSSTGLRTGRTCALNEKD